MQQKSQNTQFGAKSYVWLHHSLSALLPKEKVDQKTKTVIAPPSLALMLTKFNGGAAIADKPALVICAPTSLATAPITVPLRTTIPLPAGKLEKVVQLMSDEDGATIDELMSLTGWRRHTVRAAICRLRQREYSV